MSEPVVFQRVVAAPPATVFDALLSHDGQTAFYGNDAAGWIMSSRSDAQVGGTWTIDFGPSPDEIYRHEHVFEAIERPSRVVLATIETRPDGTTLCFETEFRFEPHGDGTLMTMIQRGLPTEQLRAEHAHGVPNAFDRLERFVATPR